MAAEPFLICLFAPLFRLVCMEVLMFTDKGEPRVHIYARAFLKSFGRLIKINQCTWLKAGYDQYSKFLAK